MTRVPLAAPGRLGASEREAIDTAIARVLENGPWILGAEVVRFEEEFAQYLGSTPDSATSVGPAGEVVGVGNGTDALVVAFTALGLPAGSGVLIAANEGGYAATAARLADLEPVVMDIAESTFAPAAATAQAAWREGVSALVVTHLHGEATDVAELDAWRQQRNLRLIEDCAQAHGARHDGRHVGLRGDAATFSFYPTKNLGTVGDAGAVLFADPLHAELARALRQYGWRERFSVDIPGGRNSRIDPLHAAILSARLAFLDGRNERRRAISAQYRAALAGSAARIHGDPETTVAHHAVVVTQHRDELAAHLASDGIDTDIHYPHLLQEMPGLGLTAVATPNASRARDQILTVPCFPEMTADEVDRVTDSLLRWARDVG